jgi:hypothetical protein
VAAARLARRAPPVEGGKRSRIDDRHLSFRDRPDELVGRQVSGDQKLLAGTSG